MLGLWESWKLFISWGYTNLITFPCIASAYRLKSHCIVYQSAEQYKGILAIIQGKWECLDEQSVAFVWVNVFKRPCGYKNQDKKKQNNKRNNRLPFPFSLILFIVLIFWEWLGWVWSLRPTQSKQGHHFILKVAQLLFKQKEILNNVPLKSKEACAHISLSSKKTS